MILNLKNGKFVNVKLLKNKIKIMQNINKKS